LGRINIRRLRIVSRRRELRRLVIAAYDRRMAGKKR
jgi:hypothetical protein